MNEVALVLKSVTVLISSLKSAQKEHSNRGTMEDCVWVCAILDIVSQKGMHNDSRCTRGIPDNHSCHKYMFLLIPQLLDLGG